MSKELVPVEVIENRIYLIRGQKVMLDKDLAILYGVLPKYLNQQVSRNIERFPKDFMFQLSMEEKENLRLQNATSNPRSQSSDKKLDILISQNAMSSWGGRRYLPYAFTEQGVAMLSSVLRSKRAVFVNIQIMRAFVKLRRLISTHEDLRRKIAEMEKKYDGQFKVIFDAINEMMAEPPTKVKGVGFKVKL